MRAILCERYGPVDELALRDVPDPELRPGTVQLDVLAAGVNHVDNLIVGGTYQLKTPTPFVPGWEFVGRITAVADDVVRDVPALLVGQRVLVAGGGGGGFAERAVVPAHRVITVPDAISDGQAATFGQSYLTAAYALRHRVHARRGDSLLVIGAGSGVGLAAVDVAASMDLRVLAAASTEDKRRLALDRGAEVALDVRTDDVKARTRELMAADGKAGVDLVLDPVGGELAETWLRCLGDDGRYLVVGFVAGIPSLPLNQVLLRSRHVIGVDWGAWAGQHTAENATLLRTTMRQIASGELRPVEPTVYPLERTAEALRDLAERRASGKLVIRP